MNLLKSLTLDYYEGKLIFVHLYYPNLRVLGLSCPIHLKRVYRGHLFLPLSVLKLFTIVFDERCNVNFDFVGAAALASLSSVK